MRKALIIVDAQNDFFEGGALAVPESNSIIPVINRMSNRFEIVIFTKDWHPADHKSFASSHPGKKLFEIIDLNGVKQILWPDHCVQNSFGSKIHKDIEMIKDAIVVTKGLDKQVDSYSGFYDNLKIHSTGMLDILREKKVSDTYICGLAADYCVKFTALDSAELGFNTFVIADATKPVNMNSGDYEKALEEMKGKGINIVYSYQIIDIT